MADREQNAMAHNEVCRDRTLTSKSCGFVPFPENGAYGHWTCQLPRRHRGRHRFNNYTVARVPRFWRVKWLWRDWKCQRRLRQFGTPMPGIGYRRSLYPTKYEPVDR